MQSSLPTAASPRMERILVHTTQAIAEGQRIAVVFRNRSGTWFAFPTAQTPPATPVLISLADLRKHDASLDLVTQLSPLHGAQRDGPGWQGFTILGERISGRLVVAETTWPMLKWVILQFFIAIIALIFYYVLLR